MKRKRLVIFFAAFATVYVGAYLALSLAGKYTVGTWGLNGIKSYVWSPKYFVDHSGRFRRGWAVAFLPLYWLDLHCWHNDWTGESGPRYETIPPWKPTH